MKYTRILLFSTLALLSANVSLFAKDSSSSPVKIGATLALSGKLAFIGKEERDGLILAVDEVNENGGVYGRRLEILFEDNIGDTKTAVTGVNKLLNLDRVDVIFSAFTHVTQAVKDLVARQDKTLIYASSLGSIAKSNPRFFRDYFDAGQSGEAIGQAIIEADSKKVAILTEINDACEDYEKHLLELVQAKQVQVTKRVAYLPGETEFQPLLLKIRQSKPDGIVFCTWRDTDIVMKQLDQLGMIDIPIYHFIAPFLPHANTAKLRALYEKNNLISSWYGFVESTNEPKQLEFIKKFEKRFNRKPRPDAAFAYDNIMLLANALLKCAQQAVDPGLPS